MDWKLEWFPHLTEYFNGFWNKKKNQRNFMTKFAKKFHIKKPEDWGNITLNLFMQAGGTSVLDHYENSLLKALENIYPGLWENKCYINEIEISWKREWFVNLSKFPHDYWNLIENQRKFLDEIASEYNIKTPNDWKRVSMSLIRKKGGQVSENSLIQFNFINKGIDE